MSLVHEIEQEAGHRNYYALSICVAFPDGTTKLVHFNDECRHKQFHDFIKDGATPVGKFFIYHTPEFGFLCGAEVLTDSSEWTPIIKREMDIMTDLISTDKMFRNITSAREMLIQ